MSAKNMEADEIPIREARQEDCEQIVSLIQDLAVYEKMPNGPTLTADILRKDGFGEEKMFRCFVADDNGRLVGYALYFFNYSSWEGVNVYLEDIYVSPEYRHQEIGTRLWKSVAKVAAKKNCKRMDWVCLGWNTSAIEFYKSKGSINLTADEEWNVFRLCGNALKEFAK